MILSVNVDIHYTITHNYYVYYAIHLHTYTHTYIHTYIHSLGVKRYIDILQYLLLQYNTIWSIENIDILHIAIYCILQYIAMLDIVLDIVLFLTD